MNPWYLKVFEELDVIWQIVCLSMRITCMELMVHCDKYDTVFILDYNSSLSYDFEFIFSLY